MKVVKRALLAYAFAEYALIWISAEIYRRRVASLEARFASLEASRAGSVMDHQGGTRCDRSTPSGPFSR